MQLQMPQLSPTGRINPALSQPGRCQAPSAWPRRMIYSVYACLRPSPSWQDRKEAAERAPRKRGPGPANSSQNSLAPASLTDAPPAVRPRYAGCGCPRSAGLAFAAAPSLPGAARPPATARFPSRRCVAFEEIIIMMLGEESKRGIIMEGRGSRYQKHALRCLCQDLLFPPGSRVRLQEENAYAEP